MKTEDVMMGVGNAINKALKHLFGRKMGFVLFVFPYIEAPDIMGNYISNVEFEVMVRVLKAQLDRLDEGVTLPMQPNELH